MLKEPIATKKVKDSIGEIAYLVHIIYRYVCDNKSGNVLMCNLLKVQFCGQKNLDKAKTKVTIFCSSVTIHF